MDREMTNGGQRASGLEVERSRITGYYGRRAAAGLEHRYSLFNPGQLYLVQHLERDLLAALRRHGFAHFAGRSILDVGCGDGWFLRRLASYGADRRLLAGVDLLPARIEAGRQIDPDLDVRHGDAGALTYPDRSFDLVFQLTVFSSILDDRMRRAVAIEMARVLKPAGAIVSYDFLVARDRRNTRPIGARELASLFPGFVPDARRVTLFPPLARLLAGRSWAACELLETIPLLRTHELVVLRPEARGSPNVWRWTGGRLSARAGCRSTARGSRTTRSPRSSRRSAAAG